MNFPGGSGGYHYVGEEVDEAWFDRYLNLRERAVRCAIVEDETDRLMGCTYLLNIDRTNMCAEFHIMIGNADDRGKGAGTFAIEKMLHHAFMDLNLHRLTLDVLEDNVAAIKLYTHAGFVKEGVKREAVYKNGSYHNEIFMSLLHDEYIITS